MMKTIFHRILTSAALCLAAAGVGGCTEIHTQAALSDNYGTGATSGDSRLYIEDVSTSEDLYADGSFHVVDVITARLVYEGESKMIKIHNYHPARVGYFKKGQCYLLPASKKLEKLNANSVILPDEILQLCPTEIENQNNT